MINSESQIENPEVIQVPAEVSESSSDSSVFRISPGEFQTQAQNQVNQAPEVNRKDKAPEDRKEYEKHNPNDLKSYLHEYPAKFSQNLDDIWK